MATPFLGEIKLVSFNFPPKGWSLCNGQLLSITQNTALFALLGTTYGGDGRTTFGLPNLQGRIAMHQGSGFTLGQQGGEQSHTLNINEIPLHTHQGQGGTGAAVEASTGNVPGQTSKPFYSPNAAVALNPQTVANTGGNQPHDNMSPYLSINFVIALQGIFPSQN